MHSDKDVHMSRINRSIVMRVVTIMILATSGPNVMDVLLSGLPNVI